MSHYNVNAGVPKTLIQHLIRWVVSSEQFDDEVNRVLVSVLDTEKSDRISRCQTQDHRKLDQSERRYADGDAKHHKR